MSNFDSTKKTKNKTENHLKTNARKRWSFIQSDLGSVALEWDILNQQEKVKSPEELQLEKVKNIIENLKDKLNEF